MMYEELVLKLRAWENAGESNSCVFGQAVNAIEELKAINCRLRERLSDYHKYDSFLDVHGFFQKLSKEE